MDLLLHLDEQLRYLIEQHGAWTYAILFAIIFAETGLVVTPFLPGDSLLFATGTFAASGELRLVPLMLVLTAAAIIGDSVNYWIGAWLSPRVFRGDKIRFLNQKHLDRTHAFYEQHGAKTVVLARFVPIVRTFAPFVAGLGAMTYRTFMTYNVLGALLWVVVAVLAGYFFGSLPVVEHNFELVVLAIVMISVLPMFYELIKLRLDRSELSSSPDA
jgi:membrane-associated protein